MLEGWDATSTFKAVDASCASCPNSVLIFATRQYQILVIEGILILQENYCTGLIFHLLASETLHIRVNTTF